LPIHVKRPTANANGAYEIPVADSQSIESVADEMLMIASTIKADIVAVLNGTKLEVRRGAMITRENLIQFFHQDQAKKKVALVGPVYQNPQVLIDKHQQEMNILMGQLEGDSFYKLDVMIEWLAAVFKNQLAEVNFDADNVVAALETKGYDDSERAGSPSLNIQDGSAFGTNIVGRAISDLKRYGRLVSPIGDYCKHWQKKYSGQGLKKAIGKGGFKFI